MQAVRRGYFRRQVPERWEEGILCGNGSLGAIVMARPLEETITFSHEKLFIPWKEKLPPVDSASHLPEIRAMLAQGRFEEAAEFVVELARQANYGPKRWTDMFFPACDLEISLEPDGEVEEYAHSLDYTSGLAAVEWQDQRGRLSRQVFVSRADGVAVVQVKSADGARFSGNMAITRHPPDPQDDYWAASEKYREGFEEPLVQVEPGWMYYHGHFRRENSGYECLARVVSDNGMQIIQGDRLYFSDTDELLVFLEIRPQAPGENPHHIKMRSHLATLPLDFPGLLARHTAIHGELFERTLLEMGDSDDYLRPAEEVWSEAHWGSPGLAYFRRIFDAGRYEILCSSGEWAPNLQGVWTGIYGVPWSSDYTQNGNVQTAIAGLLSGNLPECLKSYLQYLEFLAPESRVNARTLYCCRGQLLASRTSSHGLNNHFDATWPMTFWTAGAGWGAHFFYDTWLHTCDDDFFRQRALPYMKEVADFYEDFLLEDENGCWCFSPSYSPENNPANSDSQACVNATMDIAVARQLFHNIIEGCRTLQLEAENLPRWEAILAKMPPYLINQDGAVKEWCDPHLNDRYDHRHASHLYPLMYGVAKELAEDAHLLGAFTKAYQFRLAKRVKEANVMAFGSVQLAQAAVHLKDSQPVYSILEQLASGYYFKNFATSHDRGPSVFNADLSGGMPYLISEMLLQSETINDVYGGIAAYRIYALPAIPTAWRRGRLSGALVRGGFEVDIEWDNGELTKMVLHNHHGQKCHVQYQGKEIQLEQFVKAEINLQSFNIQEIP